jgi:hypothetical protein
MAKYTDPDDFLDKSQVPWGENDYGNPDPAKMDSIRQSLWGSNRFTGAAYQAAVAAAEAANGVRGEVIDILRAPEFDAPGVNRRLSVVEAKIDALLAAAGVKAESVAAVPEPEKLAPRNAEKSAEWPDLETLRNQSQEA